MLIAMPKIDSTIHHLNSESELVHFEVFKQITILIQPPVHRYLWTFFYFAWCVFMKPDFKARSKLAPLNWSDDDLVFILSIIYMEIFTKGLFLLYA